MILYIFNLIFWSVLLFYHCKVCLCYLSLKHLPLAVFVWYFVKYQILCCWHNCILLTLGGETDLFGYSFFPSSLIFASIGEMQHSFSMEHAIFHLSDISSVSGNCVVTHPLHPLKDNIMRRNEIACLTYYLSKIVYL